MERVKDEFDPERCQHVIPSQGQCSLRAVPGCTNCAAHGGVSQNKKLVAGELRNYRLNKFRAEIAGKANNDHIKNLSEEIGILRQILEETINACADEYDLISKSTAISDMVVKIEKLVSSCARIDGALKKVLDEGAAMQFANEAVEIVARHVEDEDAREAIANELEESLTRLLKSKADG